MEDPPPYLSEIRDLLAALVRSQQALLANQPRIMEDLVEPLKELKRQAEHLEKNEDQNLRLASRNPDGAAH
jgi:hypothetical protein